MYLDRGSKQPLDLYYRPPSSDEHYCTNMENSFGLAVDTGISDLFQF